jgi:hypothetical protein
MRHVQGHHHCPISIKAQVGKHVRISFIDRLVPSGCAPPDCCAAAGGRFYRTPAPNPDSSIRPPRCAACKSEEPAAMACPSKTRRSQLSSHCIGVRSPSRPFSFGQPLRPIGSFTSSWRIGGVVFIPISSPASSATSRQVIFSVPTFPKLVSMVTAATE